jgi:Immunity protein 51
MLEIDQLKFPPKLRAIIADEGSYEDDSLEPMLIRVSMIEHKGRTVLGYQLILEAGEHYEDFEDLMYDANLKINGDTWEALIRKYLKSKDAAFEKQIEGDSEGAKCVLWSDKEETFRKLLAFVVTLLKDVNLAKGLL